MKLSNDLGLNFKQIANDAELKVNYIESTWGGFPADLNSGKCDFTPVVYPMIGRSTSVSFTKPYIYSGNGGVVNKDETRFESIER